MARKSRKNMMPLEATALPDKEKKVLFKAGLYARLSHETEENIERGTIETQMELMKNYVKDHEDIVIEEEYYDASFTGTNFERPDFKRMLEDAKTGRINCIIVKDLSRLGRNYVEMGNYIERVFPFLNVRFIAVTDDFDSFRPGTDLMMPLKNIVNEFYAKDISKKVSTAHRRKWTTDEYMCGFAPYGYLKSKTEKNRIVVDEATAGNVRLIYKLFLEGKGYTSIAKYLNEQGIMSPLMYLKSLGYQQNVKTNGVWTKTTVKSILTNQAYIGSAVHGKVVIEKYNNIPLHATDPSEWVIVENTHEPLVDKETFEKAQERVKEISDAYFAKEFTKHPPNEKNLLKGKIVCGDCGKGMRLSPRTTKSYVYFCGTFSDGINPACSRHKIDQEDVNKAVFAQISNHTSSIHDILNDEVYLGKLIWNKTKKRVGSNNTSTYVPKDEWIVIENCHEPIITQKLFDTAHANSKKYIRPKRGKRNYNPFYYCGVCGRALVPSKRVKGDILLCSSSRIEENSPCKSNRVEIAKVENTIMKIVNMYATAYLDEKGIKKAGKSKEVSPEEKIATLEKKVKSLSSKKMMLYSDYKDDKLTREEYVKRSKAMVEQIDELHQEIEQLKTEIPPEDNSSSKFETQLESIINMESFDREKIQKVIKKVIINGEDNIEIIWNTDDPFFK